MEMMDWIKSRSKEPSTWAGVGVACVVVSMMLGNGFGWIAMIGVAAGIAGVLLKEKVI
tara:strand:- start:294 stop:467 length:174 start_codon:yes stop_codon:yes gene_type:complete